MTGTSLDPRIAAGQPGAVCVSLTQPASAESAGVSQRQAASGDLPSAAQDEVAADDEQGEGEYPRAK